MIEIKKANQNSIKLENKVAKKFKCPNVTHIKGSQPQKKILT